VEKGYEIDAAWWKPVDKLKRYPQMMGLDGDRVFVGDWLTKA
jgi:hypothetical protein